MAQTKRISISVPAEMSDNLTYISSRLGISRSGFVTQLLLAADLDKLSALISTIPEQPSEADARRFRGDSKAYIAEQLERIQHLQGGLFDESSD